MVSKLNAVFRNFIGSDNHQPISKSRKRPSESLEDVSQDVLETPQPKRARPSNHSAEVLHNGHSSTPLVKVASWIRQKASSFGETYFFRPVGNFIEKNYPVEIPAGDILERTQVMSDTTGQQAHVSGENKNRNRSGDRHVSFKRPDGPPQHRETAPSMSRTQSKHPEARSNGRQVEINRLQQTGVPKTESKEQPGNTSKSSTSSAANSSMAAAMGRSKQESYIPVRDKLFPDPKRRVVVSHVTKPHRPHVQHSSLAVNECVRLNERQQYKQLLEQYTRGYSFEAKAAKATHAEAALGDTKPNESAARPKAEASGESTASSRLEASLAATQQQQGTRVLPHKFTSQRELREAVRQRLHAPTSLLSPGTPQGDRPPPMTPAQPDFNDSSPPITITSVKPGPGAANATPTMSAFQKSLCATPYLTEDWVQDLKARFESSVRLRHREIEEHQAKLQLYEERRAKDQIVAQEQIKARISRASRVPGVVEDTIYRPEEKEAEDEIEVIDEEEDEDDDGVEEEEEEELALLTGEMEDEIRRALNPNPSSETLVSGFRLNITRRDMQTLAGLNWLNDEIMNFYFEMLMARSKEDDYLSVHSFNTFFYPKLINSGYASLRRWTKRVDIFTKDLILVPVHLGMHWCLAVIDFRHQSIIFYDSMGSHNQKCLDALRDYLVAEYADKKKLEFSMTEWSYYSERNIPQQLNGSDCGMFACKYAEYISRDAPITFTQHDMPYFRRRMVWEILHTTLL